jgi:Fe-S-cluster containining protein
VSQKDVDRWKNENRIDILDKLWLNSFVCEHCNISWPAWQGDNCPMCGKHSDDGIYYWLDQRRPRDFFSQQMASPRCPFLKKTRGKDEYSCLIHETKPEICRGFPQLDENEVTGNEEECIEWGCKGYSKWKKKREKGSKHEYP